MRKALVVGSGFGGVAAALRLRARGDEVVVVEMQPQLGGKATTLESPPFFYDAGPTVITADFLLDELFALFGRCREDEIPFIPVTPWYSYKLPSGDLFRYGPSLEATVAEIERLFPADVNGYLKFYDHTKELFRIGYEEFGSQPFDSFFTFMKCVPSFLKLRAFKSCYDKVSEFFISKELIQAFSVPPLLIGGNPYKTPSIYLLIHYLENKWGVKYPKGGTRALVEALTKLARDNGIIFHTSKEIQKLKLVDGAINQAITTEGEKFEADRFFFNGDPVQFYKSLFSGNSQRLTSKVKSTVASQGMGLFVVYFSTKKKYENVDHHTIVLTDHFKEHIDAVFNHYHLPRDPCVYLHRPRASDPSMAPEGHDSFYALVPVPNLRGPLNWEDLEEDFAKQILEQIEKSSLPGLKESIVDFHYRSPTYYQNSQNCFLGSPFSIQPTLRQSAYFRYGHKIPEVSNGFFVGAGTHPGGGIPGVLTSAKVLEAYL